jgi:DNA segregation ATPase FtsK/SpoIIIE, S-DNA-T family
LSDQQPVLMNGFQRLLEVGLILAGGIALYILITLFSYDPADPSWTKTGNYEYIKNAGGAFGAWLSDILLFTFGWLAFFIPVLLSVIGWLFFRKFHDLIEIDYLALGLRLIGFVFVIMGLSAICSMNFDDVYYYSSGGIIGDVIAYLLTPLFGFTGATLIFLILVMTGFTLTTGISWLQVVEGTGKYTLIAGRFLESTTRSLLGLDGKENLKVSENYKVSKNSSNPEVDQTASKTSNADSSQITPTEISNGDITNNSNIDDDAVHSLEADKKEEPLEDSSLLARFFAKTEEVNDKPTELKPSPSPSLESNSESAQGTTSPAKNDFLDDDMPFGIDDEPLSYSSIDDELTDDDIKGALDGLQNSNNEQGRETAAIAKTEVHAEGIIRPDAPVEKPPITLPSLELLDRPDKIENPVSQEELEAVSRLVEAKLKDFNIEATVVGVYPGPVITRFELDLAPGIKVSKISGLSKDLARSLSAMSVRVVEVIPGKSYIGLEIPNKHRQIVRLSEVMSSESFDNAASPLTMVLGKDIGGKAVVVDLAKMPHLLVAGTTGSGKSVGVNTMILSLLYKSTPDDVRLIMIDPKMLELSVYEGIPHLLSEVVTDMKEAANALRWCVGEMERRYKLMSALGVRNLKGYNAKIEAARAEGKPIRDPLWRSTDNMLEMPPELERLPAIVVVIDEFADMMMIVGKKVEELIARIAQKARAAGIHLVLATQRPSVDVITGLIKANIPTRMAFQVSSKIDSRTILDQQGAENLLGMGDMLYLPPGSGVPTRVHGAFVDDHEVHAVVKDWKSKAKPNYIKEILEGDMTEEKPLRLLQKRAKSRYQVFSESLELAITAQQE